MLNGKVKNENVKISKNRIDHNTNNQTKYPGKRPQKVFARSVSRKSRDLDALGSREVMEAMQ